MTSCGSAATGVTDVGQVSAGDGVVAVRFFDDNCQELLFFSAFKTAFVTVASIIISHLILSPACAGVDNMIIQA